MSLLSFLVDVDRPTIYVLFTALAMTVPWVGLSWLGWYNSKQMRAVFPGGEGRLFLAILMATMPWFLGPSLLVLAGKVTEAFAGGKGRDIATAVIFALFGFMFLAAMWASRRLIALYMNLRAAQAAGGDLRQAALDAMNEYD